MTVLPTFYYLEHFHEFLRFIEGPSADLLNDAQRQWLTRFNALNKPSQCLIARASNRKHALIKIDSMQYDEIDSPNHWLQVLSEDGWFSRLTPSDIKESIALFTKPELLNALKLYGPTSVKSNSSKATLVDIALKHLDFEWVADSGAFDHYLKRAFDQELRYFLFLFFGHLRGTLSQFSMRDLGVMRTRRDSQNSQAHFNLREEAESAFYYAQLRRDVKNGHSLPALENLPPAYGHLGQRYRDEVLFIAGKDLLTTERDTALSLLAASNQDEAQEKWIRECYKDGNREAVENQLQSIIDNPASENLLVFAQDFMARKYHKKRTSRVTDLLKSADQVLSIDENYINAVERGVVSHYQRKGVIAKRTENQLWLSFFGLAFWDIIYEQDQQGLSNEFDIRPNVLQENRLYSDHQHAIEARFDQWRDARVVMGFLAQQVSLHHGKVNSLFQWHSKLLDNIKLLVEHSPLQSCVELLRAMAKDYQSLRDGFPDLMIIDNGTLRFEEVKAPGDVLRRNQLVSLDCLTRCGFSVGITRVNWCRDPMQPYVVIDIETTGGRASQHRITEIGIVKRVNQQTVARWHTLLNPMRSIPANITALTGIDNAMVADAPVFADIADDLEAFTQDCIFVAHNVNFDYGFIREEFARLDRSFRRPKFCTCAEMRRAKPGLRSYSLANLTAHFGIEMSRHHRAMSDAEAAASLLDIIHDMSA